MPMASQVEDMSVGSSDESMSLEKMLASLKTLGTSELFKVLKAGLSEAEKKTKTATKVVNSGTTKKTGSMPKGVVPPQLRKPRAWVDFVLKHALENGWESFTVHQSRKDKETGEKIEEEIEMPGSILHEGAYVYEDSVTEKTPSGKQLIHKDAMSLSKHYWTPKEKKGTKPELYTEFEAQYVDETPDVSETSSVASSKIVVKKTAAEKAAESEAKKAEKEAEKAVKKAEKEAERAAKKAEKEAEKAVKKAEKEVEKAAKKAEKDSTKKTTTKTIVPATAVKKSVSSASSASAPIPVPAPVAVPVPKKKMVVKKEEWSCPSDGMVHPWPYKGKQYLRNSENEVWLRGADGGCGLWQGIYIVTEDRIDDSVPEPVFEDEE
jgi:hypothetical protein